MRELVANDGTGMRDQGSNNILLQPQGEIQVRPRLVPIFEGWHTKNEIMHVFEVAFAFALVAETEDDAGDFDVGKSHVV